MGGSKRVVRFAYYDRLIYAAIPEANLVDTAKAAPVEPLADIPRETARSLEEPIGAKPLSRLAAQAKKILIAVPDHTRRTDFTPVLSALLAELKKYGAGPDRIKIAIAGGTHAPMSEAELRQQWGDGLPDRFAFIRHRWDQPANLVKRGVSRLGIPLEFNKALFEADLLVGLGTVKPHPVAGWSRGAKIILPGLAGKATTDYLHWTAAGYPVETIFGQAENPVRQELEEAVGEIGLALIINVVENRDGEIAGLAAGDYIQAHRYLVEQARSIPLIDLPLELPNVMLVGGGADRPELWEAMAGLYLANILLQEGGTLVLVAACPGGVAREHPAVLEWGYRPYGEIAPLVEQNKITDLTAASHMALVGDILSRKKFRVILVSSGINAGSAGRLGLDHAGGLDEALEKVWRRHGREARLLTYERI